MFYTNFNIYNIHAVAIGEGPLAVLLGCFFKTFVTKVRVTEITSILSTVMLHRSAFPRPALRRLSCTSLFVMAIEWESMIAFLDTSVTFVNA